jgi:antitoxin FitA
MAALSIRDLDDEVRERLRVRAAQHGRSMEAEIRAILVEAVMDSDGAESLFDALRARIGALGGVELELPDRTAARLMVLPT